jgi:hypothetical protein
MISAKATIERVPVMFRAVACIAVALLVLLTPAAKGEYEVFSYKDYADILRAYVDDRGMVNYTALKEHRGPLDAFVTRMAIL